MKTYKSFTFTIIILLSISVSCKKTKDKILEKKPFPQHTIYAGDHILPDNYTQEELDEHTRDFYDVWKNKYIKNDCEENSFYVDFDNGNTICVSEGLGYGMMITVIMAGYDEAAKTYFDGMFNFFKAHPSSINSQLMAWEQIEGCITNPDDGDDAASDGDIDIAYALLLADNQWGSSGTINYISEANKLIAAIKQDEINQETMTVKLGDWANSSEPQYFFSTRTSDFITDHFKAFQLATSDDIWTQVSDSCYHLIDIMQTNFSPLTGLIPDFILNTNTSPIPASEYFLESEFDGNYYYNACRVPWRLTNDFLINGDSRTKTAIEKINNWLMTASNNNPENIYAGYLLDGTPIEEYNDIAFFGAFAVSAMISNNQAWVNGIYDQLLAENINDNDYYANTLKMLYLITLSQNYWTYNI